MLVILSLKFICDTCFVIVFIGHGNKEGQLPRLWAFEELESRVKDNQFGNARWGDDQDKSMHLKRCEVTPDCEECGTKGG